MSTIHEYFENSIERARSDVQHIDAKQLVNKDIDKLTDEILKRYQIAAIKIKQTEEIRYESKHEHARRQPLVNILIPIEEGDNIAEAISRRASSYSTSEPELSYSTGVVTLSTYQEDMEKDYKYVIEKMIPRKNSDIEIGNQKLQSAINQELERRRERVRNEMEEIAEKAKKLGLKEI